MTQGHVVYVLDNLFTGQRKNIEHWIGHPNFQVRRASRVVVMCCRRRRRRRRHALPLTSSPDPRLPSLPSFSSHLHAPPCSSSSTT